MMMAQPVCVDRKTAAKMLGMSLSHFERHVQPDLRLIYSGRLRLVPVYELERWAKDKVYSPSRLDEARLHGEH